jgi:hypothetical protein
MEGASERVGVVLPSLTGLGPLFWTYPGLTSGAIICRPCGTGVEQVPFCTLALLNRPHDERGVIDRRIPAIADRDLRSGFMVGDLFFQLSYCE